MGHHVLSESFLPVDPSSVPVGAFGSASKLKGCSNMSVNEHCRVDLNAMPLK